MGARSLSLLSHYICLIYRELFRLLSYFSRGIGLSVHCMFPAPRSRFLLAGARGSFRREEVSFALKPVSDDLQYPSALSFPALK